MSDANSIESLRARIAEIEAKRAPLGRSHATPSQHKAVKAPDNEAAHNTGGEQTAKAWAKVLRSASVREQSTVRMRGKLRQAGFSEDVIEQVLNRAVQSHVIDDNRYSDALVRSAIAQGKGLEIVRREIEELDVPFDDLQAVKDYRENEGANEHARAISVLERFPPTAKNKREAAFRKLLNKGFSVSVAASAARTWTEMRG